MSNQENSNSLPTVKAETANPQAEQIGTDVVSVYKRVFAAIRSGKGIRLSHLDCLAITCDGASTAGSRNRRIRGNR